MVFDGACVWARRALNSQKSWFLARAAAAEAPLADAATGPITAAELAARADDIRRGLTSNLYLSLCFTMRGTGYKARADDIRAGDGSGTSQSRRAAGFSIAPTQPAAPGGVSPGRYSHFDTTLYISLGNLHTKYAGARQNDFNVYA